MFSWSRFVSSARICARLGAVAFLLLTAACEGQNLMAGLPGLSRSKESENSQQTTKAPPPAAKPAPASAKVEAAPLPPPPVAAQPGPAPAPQTAQQPFVTPQTLPQQDPAPGSAPIRTSDMTYVPPGETVAGSSLGQPATVLSSLPPGGLPNLPSKSGQKMRAAFLVPLSGPSAHLGKALLNAAQLALFEMSGSGFSLVPIDTRGTPEGAASAARQAADQGAAIILGPLFSAEVKAVAPIALASGIHVIGFSSDRSASQPGVFLLGFLPRPQVERVVAHASAQGMTRFAALAPNNDYGRAMMEAFRTSVSAHGGIIAEALYYDPAAKDHSDVVKRLARFEQRKAALNQLRRQLEAKGEKQELKKLEKQDTLGEVDYQAVFLPDEGGRLRSMAALLPYYDIDTPKVKLLGTMQWDDPTLHSEPALNGAWFASAPPEGRADFDNRYKQAFGSKPPRLASLGYDAAALTAVLAQTGTISTQQLLNPQGFSGIDGIFRFLPDGSSERGLAVLEVSRGTPKILAPPPAGF
ncbi:MAG: penicillin-binding protein activator [Rhodospirillales bacterium]